MFTEYRKIHIVVIAKLGINIYIYIQTVCWERGNIHCVRPLGRMHTILVVIESGSFHGYQALLKSTNNIYI